MLEYGSREAQWRLVRSIFAALSLRLDMRRAQAILVIVALLATPLALLARSAGGSMSGCAGMCCPTHGSHAARVLHEKMLCHHGEFGHVFECTMTSRHHGVDYGLIVPVAPTAPSAIAFVGIPDVSRAIPAQLYEVASFGFLSTPFKPPRV
jgi:hypothetical protein